MAANSLSNKFMKVLNEVPNFVTDETAQAGNRTYKYLNLATILKTIKPVFEKHGLAFSQRVTFDNAGEGRSLERWRPSSSIMKNKWWPALTRSS